MAFWRQKASLLCTTQQRSNQLLNQFDTYMQGKNTRYKVIQQAASNPLAVTVMVDYNDKVDADAVWSQITTANTNGWITEGSFAGYSQMPENESEQYVLLSRIDW